MHVFEGLNQSSYFVIGLFTEAGIHFHLLLKKFFLIGTHAVPCRNFLGTLSEQCILGNDSHFLLLSKNLISQFIPPFIELPFVFITPFFCNMMWCMQSTR